MFRKLAGLTALAGLFFTGSAFAAIDGSAHDFVGATWYSGGGEICKACHAPHNNEPATGDLAGMPLWNHTPTATASFGLYVGLDMQAVPGQPSGVSKLCLSCHDGTIALDSYGGGDPATNTQQMGDVNAGADVGTDLSNDHPISIDYTLDTSLAATTKTTALGGTIATDLLFSNLVECGSCHDVHNAVPANGSLLKITNTNSDLCQTCHEK